MMYWKDKATLEGDYIYLEGDKGMKGGGGNRGVTLRDQATRGTSVREGCQDTAGHGVKRSWMGSLIYSGAYVLFG